MVIQKVESSWKSGSDLAIFSQERLCWLGATTVNITSSIKLLADLQGELKKAIKERFG